MSEPAAAVTVIGTGYVGLVTGACLADQGHTVTCVDLSSARIADLQSGRVPFHEPGLPELLARLAPTGRLRFTTTLTSAELVVIAVGTPTLDLAPLFALTDTLAPLVTRETLVLMKSTVPPGTTEQLAARLAPATVVSNPEFLREGAALHDFRHPSRVLCGTDDLRAAERVTELYRFTGAPVLVMSPRSAELAKYAANAMLAARVSFINELSTLATALGADITQVARVVGADPRIGPHYLSPGLGFGGSCLPKDLTALRSIGDSLGLPTALLDAVHDVNVRARRSLLEAARKHFGSLKDRRFAVWGLSFKPDTDDVRQAPALELIDALLGEGATVSVFDPVAMPNARAVLGERVRYARDARDAAHSADAVFLCTEWPEFALVPRTELPLVFDGRPR